MRATARRRGRADTGWPLPAPTMMPDRIGTIGSTQGVNASSSPKPKNVASTANRLPSRILSASTSCSDCTLGAAAAAAARLATEPLARGAEAHDERLPDRRIAEALVGAALVRDLERHLGHARRRADTGSVGQHLAVEDDLFAEVFVVLRLAAGDRQVPELHVGRGRHGLGLVAVKVVVVGDVPAQPHEVACGARAPRTRRPGRPAGSRRRTWRRCAPSSERRLNPCSRWRRTGGGRRRAAPSAAAAMAAGSARRPRRATLTRIGQVCGG